MNLSYDNQTYPSLQEFVASGLQESAANKERLQFAHQIDGSILAVLETLPIKTAVNKIVELAVSQQSGIMLSTGISVAKNLKSQTMDVYDNLLENLTNALVAQKDRQTNAQDTLRYI